MKLSEMRDVLAARGIQLTKSLGQNFLHDANQLRRIVDAAELKPTDRVLEIGPGLGPLTELLLAQAGEVLAIEKDRRLVEVLRELFSLSSPKGGEGRGLSRRSFSAKADEEALSFTSQIPSPQPSPRSGGERETESRSAQFQLLHDDALDFLRRERRDWSDWKLVANLPYSVASPLLVELALSSRRPERMVVTLQLEVAQRLMATADSPDYGVLTLLVQLDYEPREHFKIPASCFFPSPDVDSACVALHRRSRPLLPQERRGDFIKIVKRAFSQRRKMMFKLLKQDWPLEALTAAFAEMNLSAQIRGEKLSLEQFVELTARLAG